MISSNDTLHLAFLRKSLQDRPVRVPGGFDSGHVQARMDTKLPSSRNAIYMDDNYCRYLAGLPQQAWTRCTKTRAGENARHHLWCLQGTWVARRAGPCHGHTYFVVHVDGDPLCRWNLDRWASLGPLTQHCWLLQISKGGPNINPVAPLTLSERSKWLTKMGGSRPGPSGWKMQFLSFFPEWVQDILWLSLDIQRQYGVIAPSLKRAVQVNLAKPKGGWRPLTMLEEAFKVIEGPVTNRLT